jgi:hypothetical protein
MNHARGRFPGCSLNDSDCSSTGDDRIRAKRILRRAAPRTVSRAWFHIARKPHVFREPPAECLPLFQVRFGGKPTGPLGGFQEDGSPRRHRGIVRKIEPGCPLGSQMVAIHGHVLSCDAEQRRGTRTLVDITDTASPRSREPKWKPNEMALHPAGHASTGSSSLFQEFLISCGVTSCAGRTSWFSAH